MACLIAAGQFSQINGQPPVVGEVVELYLAEETNGHGLRCESTRVRVAAEFEAGYQ